MAAPVKPILLAAKSATLGIADYIIFRNLTNGGKRTVKCNSVGEALVKDPPSNWANKDIISVEVQGKYLSGQNATVTNGGIIVNFGDLSSSTNTAAILQL